MLSGSEYRYFLRHDLMSFIEKSFKEINPGDNLLPSQYLEVIAARLDACRKGKIRRLIINVPPRYLKSHCASVAFPAWVLGHNPTSHLICVSYGQDLADNSPGTVDASWRAPGTSGYSPPLGSPSVRRSMTS